MFRMLKYGIANAIKQNPRLMQRVWDIMPGINMLLPHDRTYYGFRHVAQADANGLFLDIGANNGISAAGFRKVMGRPYRILSIEANPAHSQALEAMKRRDNEFDYRLTAMGSAPGELTIFTPYLGKTPLTPFSSTYKEYIRKATRRDYGEKIASRLDCRPHTVPVVRLDDLNLSPTIIKVDVEGADYEVLLGGTCTLRKSKPIVLFEYTPNYSDKLLRYLESLDYQFKTYDIAADVMRALDDTRIAEQWIDEHLQVNIFAIPRQSSQA